MKKVKKVLLTALVLLPFSATVLFTGCSNFMNGSSLKTNLEDEIKRNTASNANVSVKKSNVDDTGVLEPSGTVSDVKVGYPIELSYEPSSAYYFVKWNAVDSNGDSFSEKDVEFADASNPLTKVTINTTEKVIIQANSALREKLSFSFDGENGSTVPADSKSFYEGEEFNLSWKADSSYAFLNWEVYNASDKKTKLDFSEYSKYLVFENIKSDDTVVKILDTGKSFIIKACSVQRPKIVTATPLYDTAGVFRDRTIVVMFDNEMDESSIYWTEDEIKEILEDSFENYSMLPEEGKLINGTKYFYGYVNKSDENDVTFKNIKISELSNKSNNLLKYYAAPEFDFGNRRTLRIKTKTVDEVTEENGIIVRNKVAYAPDSAIEILVTIEKNFIQLYEDRKVGLAENYSWAYFTNYNTDVSGPVFTESKLHITAGSVNQTSYDSTKNDLNTTFYSNKSEIAPYNIKEGKLWVSAEISDAGIGASKINIVINQVVDGKDKALFYPLSGEPGYINLMLNTKVAGQNGMVSQIVDISSLPEGFYETYLVGYDKNGRYTESEKFYFIYDVVGPHITSTFNYKSTEAIDKITVVKNNNNDVQYAYSKVCDISFDNNLTERQLINLGEDSRTHKIKIIDYDLLGNETISYQNISAVPSIGMIYYIDGYWAKEYVADKEPVGIIWKLDENGYSYRGVKYGNARILDLYRDTTARKVIKDYWSSTWPNGWTGTPYCDYGIAMYKDVTANSEALSHSEIFSYLYNVKNKEKKWIDAGIEWYLPSVNEIIIRTYGFVYFKQTIQEGYNILINKNKSDVNLYSFEETTSCTINADGGSWCYPTVYLHKDAYYNVPKSGGFYDYCTPSLYMAHVTLR